MEQSSFSRRPLRWGDRRAPLKGLALELGLSQQEALERLRASGKPVAMFWADDATRRPRAVSPKAVDYRRTLLVDRAQACVALGLPVPAEARRAR